MTNLDVGRAHPYPVSLLPPQEGPGKPRTWLRYADLIATVYVQHEFSLAETVRVLNNLASGDHTTFGGLAGITEQNVRDVLKRVSVDPSGRDPADLVIGVVPGEFVTPADEMMPVRQTLLWVSPGATLTEPMMVYQKTSGFGIVLTEYSQNP